MAYVLVTPPTQEPVSVDEMKEHLRQDSSDEDGYINSLIIAARQFVETETNRALVEQVWRLDLDRFGTCPIRLAKGPVSSVDLIAYFDGAGAQRTLDGTDFISDGLPADNPRIVPGVGLAFPASQVRPGAVSITFTAGYGDPASVDARAKQAILLIAGHWFENRETVSLERQPYDVPFAAAALVASLRLPLLA